MKRNNKPKVELSEEEQDLRNRRMFVTIVQVGLITQTLAIILYLYYRCVFG